MGKNKIKKIALIFNILQVIALAVFGYIYINGNSVICNFNFGSGL